MKFPAISRFLMAFILPFLIFIASLEFGAFSQRFYQEKFLQYGVYSSVPEADSLHKEAIKFIKGKTNELPDDFSQRERQHLMDVKKLLRASTILLYILLFLFGLLLLISAHALNGADLKKFIGSVLVFGGILALAIASALFLLISSDFSAAFESFHSLFFEKGTYVFDSAREVIVRLYPEQLFMDLGVRISKAVIAASSLLLLIGAFLMLNSKNKKNKNK